MTNAQETIGGGKVNVVVERDDGTTEIYTVRRDVAGSEQDRLWQARQRAATEAAALVRAYGPMSPDHLKALLPYSERAGHSAMMEALHQNTIGLNAELELTGNWPED